ncbi:MAG: GNAT family N-acetyltransferase [Lachnospiraceae bacterium]|nr:GNAT family N-acetyltransferase [Lachnospiraceae bacterium]
MNEKQYIDAIHSGYFQYWNTLGKLKGIENHKEDGLNWLSGNINYNYYTDTLGVDDVIRRMRSNEIPQNLSFLTNDLISDPAGYFWAAGTFKYIFGTLGMAHELMDVTLPEPDPRLTVLRVWDNNALKSVGAILNTVFEYRLFSFADFEQMLKEGGYFYLAEYDGLPVGACMAQHGDNYVNISWVGTLPGFLKLGIAGHLIQEAEREGLKLGKKFGVLHAFRDVVGVYKYIGYREYCRTVQLELINET